MDFSVQFLSFFVISDGDQPDAPKRYKHYQTLDYEDYAESEIKRFLDGEFARIVKRKVEKNPNTEQAPTKIGRFLVEEGYEPGSNPNYNLFQRLRAAEDREAFLNLADELVRMYMDTSAVRGGAFIAASAKLTKYFDEPFVFVMKCDFEPKIARISDEKSLVSQVEMAISARNMKSIQYPYMPEEGMLEELELKIHQASHARYFEDFLKYVAYEKSMPEIVGERMIDLVQEYIGEKWQGQENSEEKQQDEQTFELWAASDKRDIQEKWEHERVVEAAQLIVEHKQDLELKFKLDNIFVKGFLVDYGDRLHIARHGDRYVVLIEGDIFQFDRGVSPIELLRPEPLDTVVEKIKNRVDEEPGVRYSHEEAAAGQDDDAPWD